MVIQNTTAVSALTVNTLNMRVIVKDLEVQGHLITSGSAPSGSPGAGAGSGATCSIAGNDTAGTITMTTGTGSTSGAMCDITFNSSFGTAPRVLISPDNLISSDLSAATTARTTSGFSITTSTPNDSTEYVYNYIVVQ
jgi:hypothetical protein